MKESDKTWAATASAVIRTTQLVLNVVKSEYNERLHWKRECLKVYCSEFSAAEKTTPHHHSKELQIESKRNIFGRNRRKSVKVLCGSGFAKCFDLFSQKSRKSNWHSWKTECDRRKWTENSLARRVGSEPEIYRLGCNHRWPRIRNFEIIFRLCRSTWGRVQNSEEKSFEARIRSQRFEKWDFKCHKN